MKTCNDCPKKPTCTTLCDWAEGIVSQDEVKKHDKTLTEYGFNDADDFDNSYRLTPLRPLPRLTDRQREIYVLYLQGLSHNEIAKQLGLSRQYISKVIQTVDKKIDDY